MSDVRSTPSSSSSRSRTGGWRVNLLLLAGVLVLLLVLLEIGVRVAAPEPLFAYRFSPTTWYEPTPDRSFTYSRTEFRHDIRYNEHGLRDRSVSRAKPARVRRIVVIGDSFTEALEVEFSDTICQRLETFLNETSETHVQVINLGVSGFSPVQSLRRLLDLGFEFEPDHVLLIANQNDFDDNLAQPTRHLHTIEGDSLTLVTAQVGPGRRLAFGIKDYLKSHFMSFQFVRYRLHSLRKSRETAALAQTTGDEPVTSGPRQPNHDAEVVMRATLERLQHECQDRGVTFNATMVTNKAADNPASWIPAFAGLCRGAGIDFMDLRPAFRRLEASGERGFYVIDGHWNEIGHRVAARALAQMMSAGTEPASDHQRRNPNSVR